MQIVRQTTTEGFVGAEVLRLDGGLKASVAAGGMTCSVEQVKWAQASGSYGAQRSSDALPLVRIRCRHRQMQHDAAHGRFDPGAEFEQA